MFSTQMKLPSMTKERRITLTICLNGEANRLIKQMRIACIFNKNNHSIIFIVKFTWIKFTDNKIGKQAYGLNKSLS